MGRDAPVTEGHPIVAMAYDRFNRSAEENILPEHRRYLADDLRGTVLDLGAGTGAMFPYFEEASRRAPSLRVHGVEPDPYMRRRAEDRAERVGLDVDIRDAGAESLPYDDDTFDAVVASLVFCTIPDPDRALEEVARVTKPAGEFRFLEHVRSEGLLGRIQNAATPLWKVICAGCHLDRRTGTVIANSPLEMAEIDVLEIGIVPVNRFIRGTAVPAGADEST